MKHAAPDASKPAAKKAVARKRAASKPAASKPVASKPVDDPNETWHEVLAALGEDLLRFLQADLRFGTEIPFKWPE